MRFLAALSAVLALPVFVVSAQAPARADPVGSYAVEGLNPDSGSTYRGTAVVSRNGDTYKITWKISGTTYVGTGLGARLQDGKFEIGAAQASDSALSAGYISGRSFGMAFYIEQDDGSWRGVWTYGGSRDVATEIWRRR